MLHRGIQCIARMAQRSLETTNSFLTPSKPIRIMKLLLADVAELADAQVSEACDGDIVEVQVLSSPPKVRKFGESVNRARLFYV